MASGDGSNAESTHQLVRWSAGASGTTTRCGGRLPAVIASAAATRTERTPSAESVRPVSSQTHGRSSIGGPSGRRTSARHELPEER